MKLSANSIHITNKLILIPSRFENTGHGLVEYICRDSQLFMFRCIEATGNETAAQLPNLFNLRYSDFRDMRRPKRAAPRMAKQMTVTSCFAPRGPLCRATQEL